jgi:hypothetical protein
MEKYQVGGTHYIHHSIQPWDIVDEYNLGYYLGNAIKYILRIKGIGRYKRIEDIKKAIHYLEKYLCTIQHPHPQTTEGTNSVSVFDIEPEDTEIYQGYADSFFGI